LSASATIAILAVLIVASLLWLGRRDLTRPAVAFGAPWFGFVALAQLHLTSLEQPWSTQFTLVAFGGGLLLMTAAVLAGGTAPARGTIALARDRISARRLVIAAVVLMLGAVAGAAYKAHVLHGIPLLSDNPDVVRGRVIQNGEVVVPAWSSALTGGFHLGMWFTLAAIWVVAPRTSRARLLPLWLLALAALFGVALEASRNLVVFAVSVPAVGAYVLSRPARGRRDFAWVLAAVAVLALGVGGLFALRLARADSAAHTYIQQESDTLPRLARPLLPLYVNGVYPIEAARRLYGAVPNRYPYDRGTASLTSLPDAAFPHGKPEFAASISSLMSTERTAQLSWTVATYQGRLLADFGWRGVMLGSALLGLLFGSLYRWARGKGGLLPVGVIAYVTYYSAYMVYDNQLSFTLIAGYELGVVALVSAYAFGRTDAVIAALRQLGPRDASSS
jgi:hypothetical protein